MDASAYLKRQGWRGDGHSLDHSNRGIKKPLLVSQKVDVLGVGLNKHAPVSDQWWLRAFDQGLKTLGTGEESVLASVQKHGINRGGLYGRFVQGERIAGSIGQTPQTSEVSETTGTNTPVGDGRESQDNMAIDIPPEDKLERVVGSHGNQNSHDAMMHLLRNPGAAPASMKKMLDKKRKRAERPVEKRARRKIERQGKHRQELEEKRKQMIEDGTWDVEKERELKHLKTIDRRANEFVLEAQRRGIIPLGPNEIRKGIVPTGANGTTMPGQQKDAMQEVFDQVTFSTPKKGSGKGSLKADKYAREKMKRELKRAAKAYLMGEKLPHEMNTDEKRAKREQKRLKNAQKKADTDKREAEKMATREERAVLKQERKMKKKAEKAEIEKTIVERDAALKAGKTLDEFYAEHAGKEADTAATHTESSSEEPAPTTGEAKVNEFEDGVDEIKFGMTRKGGRKKIPGVGVVDRYPTKAEKKAKKLKALAVKAGISDEEMQSRLDAEKAKKEEAERDKVDAYRAMKHGMDVNEYREALAKGEVFTPAVEKRKIAPEKLAEYQKRAAKKGVTLENYIQRREQKNAAKLSEKLGNPFQRDLMEAVYDGADYVGAEPEQRYITRGDMPTEANEMGFVIDTVGDDKLSAGDRIRRILSEGKPLAMVDTDGDDALMHARNMPIPLDPRLWQGKKVKDLPAPVRKARRDWMAARREERKSRATENGAGKKLLQKKSKGERKVAAREAFVKQILWESRKALRSGAPPKGMVTIDGVENVPLVRVESRDGMFKKEEVGLARTVARRVLRNVKREERAKNGKGKGYKKRERAAKEAARNAGISGFTDKARLDPNAYNKDLLL